MSNTAFSSFESFDSSNRMGQNGGRITLNYFDGLPDQNLINSLQSNDLKLLFKSMLKRDEITRDRALKEFNNLIKNSTKDNNNNNEINDIVLICWSQMYAKFSIDNSKSIRGQSQLITLLLIKVLKKKIGKFLPDLIPFILMGICDTDNVLARSNLEVLVNIFSQDKINKLWETFQPQIVQLCSECLIGEDMNSLSEESHTPVEERILKYDRTATICLQLLIKLIGMNKENLNISEDIQNLLSNETIWNLLNLKNVTNTKLYETVLQLIDILQDVAYWKNNKHVLKYMAKRLFKSIAQINSKNIMKFKQVLSSLLSCLNTLTDIKNGKIWKYDKHSNEKFYSLLNCSCTNVLPKYFKNLYLITEKSFKLEDTVIMNLEQWTQIWQKALFGLNDRSFVGRDGNEITNEFWEYYPKLKDLLNQNIEPQLIDTLNSCIKISELPAFCDTCCDTISEDMLELSIKSYCENTDSKKTSNRNYLDNLLTVAFSNENMSLKPLLNWLVAHITIKGKSKIDSNVAQILNRIIEGNSKNTSVIKPYIFQHLAAWLDIDNFDFLSKLFVNYLNTCNSMDNNTVQNIDSFLTMSYKETNVPCTKVVNTFKNIKPEILQNYLKVTELNIMNEVIDNYVNNYYTFEDNGAIFASKLISDDYIPKLYQLAKENHKLNVIVNAFLTSFPSIVASILLETDFIDDILLNDAYGFQIIDHTLKTLKIFREKEEHFILAEDIVHLITEKLFIHIYEKDLKSEFLVELISKLVGDGIQGFDILLPQNYINNIVEKVYEIDYKASLINSFKVNTFLLKTGSWKTKDLENVKNLINYSLIIDELLTKKPEFLNNDIVLLLTMVYEIANDYNFLSPTPDDSFFDAKHTLFKRNDIKFEFFDILEKLMNENDSNTDSDNDAILSLLLKSEKNDVIQYYKSIILFRIMNNEVDNISKSSLVDSLPLVEKYITKLLRTKEVSNQTFLNGSIILSIFGKACKLESLNKLRTVFSSELIGIKPSELMANKFKNIILMNNILLIENQDTEDDENLIPITPQRFNMILNSINQWLDSDVSFDEEFIYTRISLVQLFAKFLKFSGVPTFSGLVSEISERLLTDSLTMCQLEDTPCVFALRFESVELFNIMEMNNIWSDESIHEEIIDNLIELMFINVPDELNNQVSSTFYSLLTKQLESIKPAKLLEQLGGILKNYLNGYVTNISQNRMLVKLLVHFIKEQQQAELIEFELAHQHITNTHNRNQETKDSIESSPDNTANDEKYKIPKNLINHLCNNIPEEYLENEDPFKFLRYLWDWYLALQYFKDISYKMRQIYIEQLKDLNLINQMLTFITDQINFELPTPETSEGLVKHYNISGYSNQPYPTDIQDECRNLLIHLLYELFNEVGSLTSQWYMHIRDRSHQQSIEKFVIKNISPILINKAMDQVENDIDKLVSQDNNLSIKLNRITNEIKARYIIDEQKLEISFKLPENYPLNNIQVIGVSRVGISEMKWKQWIMSTQHVIVGMNGTMLDSLELFTKNVNLEFSGFEECAICYSILHIVDRKLPNKTCPTCNNKFHGACLYKWFRSSGKNTCPLCRTEIGFRN